MAGAKIATVVKKTTNDSAMIQPYFGDNVSMTRPKNLEMG